MQADLFNLSISNSFEREAFQRSFFEKKYTLRMDQLLGIGLVCIVFFVLVFAWGVEHGKADSRRDYMIHSQSMAVQAAEKPVMNQSIPKPVTSISVSQPIAATVELATENQAPNLTQAVSQPVDRSVSATVISSGAKYTIAHVTYVKKDQALGEVARIKAKGYAAFLVPSGHFFQICVSGFDSRKAANDSIKALRLKGIVSQDSYIRNMPSTH